MIESSSNSVSELEVYKQIDELIKLHTEFNNLQIKFNEEKEKNANLEKKNQSLENELNEMNKKIQTTNSENENKFKDLNQNIRQLKTENDQKDGKINFLEEQIKKANDICEKKFYDIAIKLNNVIFKYVNFVRIKNKWAEISSGWKCCEKNCININKLNCINGNGFGSLINDENIKYINCLDGGNDKFFLVYAENTFNKPQNCFNYSLYYFEIKCKIEECNGGKTWMSIGLESLIGKKFIRYSANDATIYYNDKNESFKVATISFNDNDIIGCGLVYPPTNKLNEEFPYVFFTQNGKQIGKGVLVKDNFNSYKPYVNLICYSVEANFGNDLEEKPFKYETSEHLILKEFY